MNIINAYFHYWFISFQNDIKMKNNVLRNFCIKVNYYSELKKFYLGYIDFPIAKKAQDVEALNSYFILMATQKAGMAISLSTSLNDGR